MPTPVTDLRFASVPRDQVLDLRHQVLRPHESREACRFDTDELPGCQHFAAFLEDRLVAIATVFPEPLERLGGISAVRLRGMACVPELQGQGIGSRLLQFALDEARRAGYGIFWCNARLSAISFYQNLGFDPVGETFQLAGIGPHKILVNHLRKAEPS